MIEEEKIQQLSEMSSSEELAFKLDKDLSIGEPSEYNTRTIKTLEKGSRNLEIILLLDKTNK